MRFGLHGCMTEYRRHPPDQITVMYRMVRLHPLADGDGQAHCLVMILLIGRCDGDEFITVFHLLNTSSVAEDVNLDRPLP